MACVMGTYKKGDILWGKNGDKEEGKGKKGNERREKEMKRK